MNYIQISRVGNQTEFRLRFTRAGAVFLAIGHIFATGLPILQFLPSCTFSWNVMIQVLLWSLLTNMVWFAIASGGGMKLLIDHAAQTLRHWPIGFALGRTFRFDGITRLSVTTKSTNIRLQFILRNGRTKKININTLTLRQDSLDEFRHVLSSVLTDAARISRFEMIEIGRNPSSRKWARPLFWGGLASLWIVLFGSAGWLYFSLWKRSPLLFERPIRLEFDPVPRVDSPRHHDGPFFYNLSGVTIPHEQFHADHKGCHQFSEAEKAPMVCAQANNEEREPFELIGKRSRTGPAKLLMSVRNQYDFFCETFNARYGFFFLVVKSVMSSDTAPLDHHKTPYIQFNSPFARGFAYKLNRKGRTSYHAWLFDLTDSDQYLTADFWNMDEKAFLHELSTIAQTLRLDPTRTPRAPSE